MHFIFNITLVISKYRLWWNAAREREMNICTWLSCSCSMLVLLGVLLLWFLSHTLLSFPKTRSRSWTCISHLPCAGPIAAIVIHFKEVAMQCECWQGQEKECGTGVIFGHRSQWIIHEWEVMLLPSSRMLSFNTCSGRGTTGTWNWVSFSLITVWPSNITACSSRSFLSLGDGSAVQAPGPAQQNSSTLQAAVPGLAQGWQAALLCGILSRGCHLHQTRVGGPGEPKFAGRIRRWGLFLLLALSPDDSHTSDVHPQHFLLLWTSCSAWLLRKMLSQKLIIHIWLLRVKLNQPGVRARRKAQLVLSLGGDGEEGLLMTTTEGFKGRQWSSGFSGHPSQQSHCWAPCLFPALISTHLFSFFCLSYIETYVQPCTYL